MKFKEVEKEAQLKHDEKMKVQSLKNRQKMTELKAKLKNTNVPNKDTIEKIIKQLEKAQDDLDKK